MIPTHLKIWRVCYKIAEKAHKGQYYGSEPYFKTHVLPLANYFRQRNMWPEAYLALLHDVMEDHPDKVTYEQMHEAGVPGTVVAACRCITKRPDESYDSYLERVKQDSLAWRVKIQDVIHNIGGPDKSKRRLWKYSNALRELVHDAPWHILPP